MTQSCLRELHELQDLLRAAPDLRDTVCQGFAVPAGAVPWDRAQVQGLIMLGWWPWTRPSGPTSPPAVAPTPTSSRRWRSACTITRSTTPSPTSSAGATVARWWPSWVAIPTWFYGHEPTNLFAASIAKYFSNSLREDRLLAQATGGIIFAPGSAGTAQEVFQDAAQNHYATFGPPSPMVFLDRAHWEQTGLFSALLRQAEGKPYADLISLVDTPAEVVAALQDSTR